MGKSWEKRAQGGNGPLFRANKSYKAVPSVIDMGEAVEIANEYR